MLLVQITTLLPPSFKALLIINLIHSKKRKSPDSALSDGHVNKTNTKPKPDPNPNPNPNTNTKSEPNAKLEPKSKAKPKTKNIKEEK
jgi:hypothetical protein